MPFRRSAGVERRHVVVVEDQLYHIDEMLEVAARVTPDLLSWSTVCAVEAPGADTSGAVAGWLERYGGLVVAARAEPGDVPAAARERLVSIRQRDVEDAPSFARMLAGLILPDGLLVQDIHLSTLRFVPQDRWWETIYAAAMVRGLFANRPPAVRFLSNKRGYTATFGRDLMNAGFDPRDVMDKSELEAAVFPAICREIDDRFPLGLERAAPGGAPVLPVSAHEEDRRQIDQAFDLVQWNVSGRLELGGRILTSPVVFRAGSQEAATWQALVDDRFASGPGIPVIEVGQRIAAMDAERAEASNVAARHIHGLRARLVDSGAIVTVQHAYRLDDRLRVGRVRRRTSADLPRSPSSPPRQTG
jgi:hypothetical protein